MTTFPGILGSIFGTQPKPQAWDWSPYLMGGGARPDAISGLSPDFITSLERMYRDAPDNIRPHLGITSAYRSDEVQQRLWDDAVKKYGSEAAARKWVAPPGKSQHNHGSAVDFKYGNDDAKAWALANAEKYGLAFPMSWEPWHIEPMGARKTQPPTTGDPRHEERWSDMVGAPGPTAPQPEPSKDMNGLLAWAMMQQEQEQEPEPFRLAPWQPRPGFVAQKRDYTAPYRNFMKTLR